MKIVDPLLKIIIDDSEEIFNKSSLSLLKNKSILITGATGLIGTYLLASLYHVSNSEKNKLKVNILIHSNLSKFMMPLVKSLHCNIFQGDITNSEFMKTLPKVDYIIHAAGYGQPGKFMEDPIKTLKINTVATLELFQHLKKNGSFLFLSTSEVYNGLTKPPFNESQIGSTNTNHPRASYIEGKRTGETICNEYRKLGIDAKSARVSLVYGPGTKPKDARVLNNFIEKALIKGEIALLDRGEAKRTYCYISDAAEIFWKILFFGKEPLYNVGGVSRITIAELAQLIAKQTGVSVKFPKISKGLKSAPDDVYLDLTKIKNEFKKVNFTPLDKGLKTTIEWQKKLYEQ